MAGTAESSCVSLTWTAPGDDGYVGQADRYEVRYSATPLTAENWDQAWIAKNPPRPGEVGHLEYFLVSDLKSDTYYYFAVKTADECDNWSAMSNVFGRLSPVDECHGQLGNANCDPDELVTISDIATLIGYLFLEGPLCCPLEANTSQDPEGKITISDIAVLIDHLFLSRSDLGYCD